MEDVLCCVFAAASQWYFEPIVMMAESLVGEIRFDIAFKYISCQFFLNIIKPHFA